MRPITYHFLDAAHRPSTAVAFRFKQNQRWVDVSWQEYYLRVEQISAALAQLGIGLGERVAICSNTRWEWACLDFAIFSRRAITVPIYQSCLPEEMAYVLNDSKAKILLLENEIQIKKWRKIASQCPHVEKVVIIEGQSPDLMTWDQFFALGDNVDAEGFRKSLQEIQLDDVATLIYTSGTTGNPRGVVLTHLQIASEMHGAVHSFQLSMNDVSLCFLPFAHVLGRVEMWLNTFVGFTLSYAEGIERIRQNLREVRPTVMIGVPRIFEKIHAAVVGQMETHPFKRKVFDLVTTPMSGVRGLLLSLPQNLVADKLVFSQVREALGGRLRFAVSGGAPLAPEIAQFFHRTGILLLEGYGLSETTGAIFVNTPEAFRFGTVGKPMDDVQLKIAPDGEILVKSQKVMKEYYNDPESTAAAFTEDGFFHTGDVGELSSDGFLRITDRKKDLIKTSGGKYVAPQKIENLLKLNPLISNVLVHGDQRKYVVVLITLAKEEVKRLNELGRGSPDQIQTTVREMVKRANAQLASYETIKNFQIMPHDFTIEAGELTPSLKVKRRFCETKYKELLDRMY